MPGPALSPRLPDQEKTPERSEPLITGDAEASSGRPSITVPISVRNVALTGLLLIAVVFAIKQLQSVLLPVVLAVLVFHALDPIVDWLNRVLPRLVATTLVLAVLMGALGGAVYALNDDAVRAISALPSAARKLRLSLRQQASGQGPIQQIQKAANEIEDAASDAVDPGAPKRNVQRVEVTEPPIDVNQYIWWGSMGTLSAVGQAIVVLFLSFFLLLSNDLYKRKLVKLAGPTLSDKKITVQVLTEISKQIERFLLVQVATSAIVGVVTWVVLWWLGVSQPAFWGLLAGVFNSVPYFGPLIVTIGLGIVALLQFGTIVQAATVAGAALVITSLEGWLLTPVLLSKSSEMNQIAVFVSLLFWSWVWGVWGAVLAVPIMTAVKAVCDHVDDLKPISELLGD